MYLLNWKELNQNNLLFYDPFWKVLYPSQYFTYNLRNRLVCPKFKWDVISKEYKGSPVLDFTKRVAFSHIFHGWVKSFTCTLSFGQMFVETLHEHYSGLVINRP